MAALDMAILLAPTEREMAEAPATIETARETLTRLGATPFLARLEEARTVAMVAASVAPEVRPAGLVPLAPRN